MTHADHDVVEPQGQDLRSEFHSELDSIRAEIAKLSAQVTEDIPRATEILLGQDLEGAEYMILADDEVDAKCVSLEERCYRVLALQSPVATDLRQVVAALRIIAEVERSADLAVNICKAARRIYGHKLDPRLRGIIQKMGDQAQKLFREATESYLTSDANRAAALWDMDNYLDDLQRQFVAAIFESHSGEGDRAAGRRPAGRRGPLLRAHRRPRREHRRARPVPRHRLDAGARRRGPLRRPAPRRATWTEVLGVIRREIGAAVVAAVVGGRRRRRGRCRGDARAACGAGPPPAGEQRGRAADAHRRRAGATSSTGCRSASSSAGRPGQVHYRNRAARALEGTHMGVLVDDAVERLLAAARDGRGVPPVARAVRPAAGRGRRAGLAARTAAARWRRSRTSASAAGSTPCAPTSSPTSATS